MARTLKQCSMTALHVSLEWKKPSENVKIVLMTFLLLRVLAQLQTMCLQLPGQTAEYLLVHPESSGRLVLFYSCQAELMLHDVL
jgi:hypothetical protein